MDSPRISALGASVLLVSLGLGVNDLVTMEGFSFIGGIAVLFAAAALIAAISLARDSGRRVPRADLLVRAALQPPARLHLVLSRSSRNYVAPP